MPTIRRSSSNRSAMQPEQTATSSTAHLPTHDPSRTPSPSMRQNHRAGKSAWWKIKIGQGMYKDVRARLPYYWSDWTDAWNYRVIPSTLVIFFANILPGLAFSLDLIETTGQYGVQEVLLASFMAAFFASVFGGQPLLISGVTGPITVFNKTIFDIFHNMPNGPNYLHFIGWTYLWAAIFHWVAAVLNAVSFLRYVTRFSCETFGFYVAAVYVQYGIQVVTRQFHQTDAAGGFLGILLAILTLVIPHYFVSISQSTYVHRHFRRFCADYGMPITVIATTGLAYWGRFNPYAHEEGMTLPTSGAFTPANGRSWLVEFWLLEGKWVGVAMPFGIVLFVLFYFDANVSSLMAQGSEFPLKKPPAFHWDFFLLGITTFISGLLGIPAPNGLIPQAPLHTQSLVITEIVDVEIDTEKREDLEMSALEGHQAAPQLEKKVEQEERPVAVVEQRVSNLAQGSLCLVLMTGPFQTVLGLIPKGVLAGLFWYMGTAALLGSGVTQNMLYLIRDKRLASPTDPLHRVRKSRIIIFTIIELLGFGATFAITQTIAAIGFPIIIMLLVPLRVYVIPHCGFTSEELGILDGPAASPFTLESVGGSI